MSVFDFKSRKVNSVQDASAIITEADGAMRVTDVEELLSNPNKSLVDTVLDNTSLYKSILDKSTLVSRVLKTEGLLNLLLKYIPKPYFKDLDAYLTDKVKLSLKSSLDKSGLSILKTNGLYLNAVDEKDGNLILSYTDFTAVVEGKNDQVSKQKIPKGSITLNK